MLLIIKDLESKINYLEDLLGKVSSEILANVFYERISLEELWSRSEADIVAIRKAAEEIRDMMLTLKPERASSIRRAFKEFMQPVNSFIELFKKLPEQYYGNSKQAIDHLRGAIAESQGFINLAKEIAKNPSDGIFEILKLKEVYEAKEYISRVSIPEAVYARLEHLKRNMEALKPRISSLEQAAQELVRQMDKLQEEISKFQRSQ